MRIYDVNSSKLAPRERGYLAFAATLVYERLGMFSKDLAIVRGTGLVIQISDSLRNEVLRRYGSRGQLVLDRLDPRP